MGDLLKAAVWTGAYLLGSVSVYMVWFDPGWTRWSVAAGLVLMFVALLAVLIGASIHA